MKNPYLADQKPDNPYYIPCAVKSLILLLLSPFLLVNIAYAKLRSR